MSFFASRRGANVARIVTRCALGGIFVYAAWPKLVDPLAFADAIATFRLLPAWAISLVALALPPLEAALGVMLIAGWRVRAAAALVAGLCGVFAIALGQAWARGLDVDCGCFGGGASLFTGGGAPMALARDAVLLILALRVRAAAKPRRGFRRIGGDTRRRRALSLGLARLFNSRARSGIP